MIKDYLIYLVKDSFSASYDCRNFVDLTLLGVSNNHCGDLENLVNNSDTFNGFLGSRASRNIFPNSGKVGRVSQKPCRSAYVGRNSPLNHCDRK